MTTIRENERVVDAADATIPGGDDRRMAGTRTRPLRNRHPNRREPPRSHVRLVLPMRDNKEVDPHHRLAVKSGRPQAHLRVATGSARDVATAKAREKRGNRGNPGRKRTDEIR